MNVLKFLDIVYDNFQFIKPPTNKSVKPYFALVSKA